jgi:hypothetical protein
MGVVLTCPLEGLRFAQIFENDVVHGIQGEIVNDLGKYGPWGSI